MGKHEVLYIGLGQKKDKVCKQLNVRTDLDTFWSEKWSFQCINQFKKS